MLPCSFYREESFFWQSFQTNHAWLTNAFLLNFWCICTWKKTCYSFLVEARLWVYIHEEFLVSCSLLFFYCLRILCRHKPLWKILFDVFLALRVENKFWLLKKDRLLLQRVKTLEQQLTSGYAADLSPLDTVGGNCSFIAVPSWLMFSICIMNFSDLILQIISIYFLLSALF